MRRWLWIGLGVVLFGVSVFVAYWLGRDEGDVASVVSLDSRPEILDAEAKGSGVLEEGDVVEDVRRPRLLRHYGDESRSALNDLQLVEDVLQRFWLFFKDPDLLSVGSNEDVVKCLTGANPEGIEFVSPDNRYIDAHGRLLDRWGTALFFHAESMTRIEVRSSGPDGRRFTEDDVVVVAGSGTRLRR